MNCVIYARVSTGQQAEKGLSLPAQLEAARACAEKNEWKVVAEYVEPGESARTADRPELKAMLAFCRDGSNGVGAVVVHKVDRLARSLSDHVAIRASLQKSGVRVVSVTENLEDSVSGRLVENIMASLAEFYSANPADEVRKGMRQKVIGGVTVRSPYSVPHWSGTATVLSCSGDACGGSSAAGASWPAFLRASLDGTATQVTLRAFETNPLYVTLNGAIDSVGRFSGTGTANVFTNASMTLAPGSGPDTSLQGTMSTVAVSGRNRAALSLRLTFGGGLTIPAF